MKKQMLWASALLIAGAMAFTACSKDEDPEPVVTPTPEPTLYERVGGTTMISDPDMGGMIEQGRFNLRRVVDSTIFVIAGDPELQPYFKDLLAEVGANDLSGFTALSETLTDFFCEATGSKNPNHAYTGMNMVDAHDPAKNNRMELKADDASFTAFVNDVVAGAAQNGVTDPALVGDLGALLGTLKGDIVQR